MGRVKAAPIALLLVALATMAAPWDPATAQPVDPGTVGRILGPYLNGTAGTGLPILENETGQDIHSEDIRIGLLLDIANVDYDLVGILFGGGKVAADAEAHLHLEFRALSMARLDEALRAATGEANASAARTFGVPSHRLALTAEEVRLAGGGALLAAFQAHEAAAARRFLEETVPGLTVLSADFAWSNTLPLHNVRDAGLPGGVPDPGSALRGTLRLADLREPPLVLDAKVRVQYLERTSLAALLSAASQDESAAEERAADLKRRVEAEHLGAPLERPAFALLGYGQAFQLRVPPGWRLAMVVQVPEGFTVEAATGDLVVDDARRIVGYALDGSERVRPAHELALATLSSRFLVTVGVLGLVVLAGFTVRLPSELGALSWAQWRQKRAGRPASPWLRQWLRRR